MGWEVIDCQPTESTPKASLNLVEYKCQIEYDSEEYRLYVSITREVLVARAISEEEDRKKFCREVLGKAIHRGHFDKIKDQWTKNGKVCYALVSTHNNERDWARIAYGATWDMKPQDIWLPGVIGVKQ